MTDTRTCSAAYAQRLIKRERLNTATSSSEKLTLEKSKELVTSLSFCISICLPFFLIIFVSLLVLSLQISKEIKQHTALNYRTVLLMECDMAVIRLWVIFG